MRLDEWKDYIEAQFLDDEEIIASPAPTIEPTPPLFVPGNLKPGTPPPIEFFLPAAMEVDGVLAVDAKAAVHTGAPSHSIEELETSDETPADISSLQVINAYTDTVAGPFSVFMPVTSYTASAHAAYVPQSADSNQCHQDAGSSPSHSQTLGARRRTRNTRNRQQVEPVVIHSLPQLAMELNADVPRHVRVLLELSRREQDREVAQSSYKRPFQETRQELIARLVDPVLSLEEAARLLNVCPTTVRRYTNRGLLNYYRKQTESASPVPITDRETRQRRFRLSDILAFLEEQQCSQERAQTATSVDTRGGYKNQGARTMQLADPPCSAVSDTQVAP